MRVAVTGARGFIGASIVRALTGRGVDVLPLARSERPDVRPDVCIHAGWVAEPGRYLDAPENLDCVAEGLALARWMADAGCRRFVGVGTCIEHRWPSSLYSTSKAALHSILSEYRALDVAWCRVFYPYGPGEDRRRLVPYVIDRLLAGEVAEVSEGKQVRDYIHVNDVGEALASVALADITGAVDIGTGVPVTVREVVDAIARECGGTVQRTRPAADEPLRIVADLSRFPLVPRFDLESGIRDTVRARRKELHA